MVPHSLRVTSTDGETLFDGPVYHRLQDRNSKRHVTHYIRINLPAPTPTIGVVAWTVSTRDGRDEIEAIVSATAAAELSPAPRVYQPRQSATVT